MQKFFMVMSSLAITLSASMLVISQGKTLNEEKDLAAKIARFAPTVITADVSKLSANDRKALDKIIEAARLFDPLYIRQVWSGNEALLRKLEADKSPLGKLRLHYFLINKGPWSQLDENASFLPEAPATKPPNAAHYPDDMTKEEFTSWVETLTPEDKTKANGFFYAIRRGPDLHQRPLRCLSARGIGPRMRLSRRLEAVLDEPLRVAREIGAVFPQVAPDAEDA